MLTNHLAQGGGSPHHLHRCRSGQSQGRAGTQLQHSDTKPFLHGDHNQRMTLVEVRWTVESLRRRRCRSCTATGNWGLVPQFPQAPSGCYQPEHLRGLPIPAPQACEGLAPTLFSLRTAQLSSPGLQRLREAEGMVGLGVTQGWQRKLSHYPLLVSLTPLPPTPDPAHVPIKSLP